jgi:hypothetical protein
LQVLKSRADHHELFVFPGQSQIRPPGVKKEGVPSNKRRLKDESGYRSGESDNEYNE